MLSSGFKETTFLKTNVNPFYRIKESVNSCLN